MKKLLRVLAVLVALCVLAGVLALAGSTFVVTTTKDRILTLDDTPPADVDCILVLGCAVRPDGSTRPGGPKKSSSPGTTAAATTTKWP